MNRFGAPQRPLHGKPTSIGGLLLLIVAVVVYSLVQPGLNARFGWNLPGLQQADAVVAKPETASSVATGRSQADRRDDSTRDATDEPVDGAAPVNAAPPAERTLSPQATQGKQRAERGDLRYGLLVDEGGERYRSPAGLLYTRGSQEGHRLKHLERHVVDNPSRPGPHGVFDGGMEGALEMVDEAYRRALTGARTTKQEEDGRVIYTVDLGKRVGFGGGRDGQRRKHPPARRVRLVLEQDRVITAYPM